MENNNMQSSAENTVKPKIRINKGLFLGVFIGMLLGGSIMWVAYPYFVETPAENNQDTTLSQEDASDNDENQIIGNIAPVVSESIEDSEKEEWSEYEGKYIKGQYTDNWEIKEILGVDIDLLPTGTKESDAINILKSLTITYKGDSIIEVSYLGDGIGYRLVCEDHSSIPVFSDTDKTLYSIRDWELNGYNPKFEEIKDKYEELDFFGTSMRRVGSNYYYDFYKDTSSFEPDCSDGMVGRIPPFTRIRDHNMSNKFDIKGIEDDNKVMLQLDRIINSLEVI